MNTVHVNLGSRSYEILVAPGLLAESGSRIQAAGLTGMAAIITDPLTFSPRVRPPNQWP